MIPAAFFGPDVSEEVIANLIFGLLETDGYVSREETGALRVGYSTSSVQLAHQLHWLLLRWGISSSVRSYDPTQQRPSIVKGRVVQSKLPMWETRITGIDNVSRFAEVIPMWGPRGQALTAALASPELKKHRGSQQGYLPAPQIAPVLAYLRGLGVSAGLAAQLIGPGCGDPQGGLRQVLGHSRLRRDRVQRLADALDSEFLRGVLAEDLYYDRIVAVTAPERCRTFDLEVDDLHTFVADGVVVHNCSSPFRQAEFDIMYGKGISREGSVLDVGVDLGIVKKSGAWYTYEGEQLGQGRENAKTFLAENAPLMIEIYDRVRQQAGITPPGIDTPLGHGDRDSDLDPDDAPISLD
jgi:RecA/RadA recombinase